MGDWQEPIGKLNRVLLKSRFFGVEVGVERSKPQ